MPDFTDVLRTGCAEVAARARFVTIKHGASSAYAASLPAADPPVDSPVDSRADSPVDSRADPLPAPAPPPVDSRADFPADPAADPLPAPAPPPAARAAFWLTLDAINFGSGWFPTLRKRPGHSGYKTIAARLRERFAAHGPWSAGELAGMTPAEIADVLGQDPEHELMALYATSLRDLGRHLCADHGGSFAAVLDAARGSAVALAELLGRWDSFADTSRYDELALPFRKRAQIAAADLARAGLVDPPDLDRLTMFADNLVPHVLRLDGILRFDPDLATRIERKELIEHGSCEEVEIRACALHAVELIVAAAPGRTAAEVDELLWNRGQQPRYKAAPRHRSRCTAY